MAKQKQFNGQVKVDFQVPQVPNFIKLANGSSLAVQHFTDDGLREIGRLWTERLIERAAQQRSFPTDR